MLFFQQAEPKSEIYCLFTKSWARRKVSCHFYTEVTQRHLGRTDCQARVPPVPVVPVGRGREPHSPLLPQPPWQQQIQSAGIQEIQEFRKKNLHFKQQFQAGPAPNHFGFPGSVFIGADPSHHRVSRNEPFFSIIGLQ